MIFINKPYIDEKSNAEMWEYFKASAEEACKGTFKIDPEMIPIIKEFNKIDGVITRFCCEGHPEKNKSDDAYVMLAFNKTGLEKLLDFNMYQSFLNIQLGPDPVWGLEHSVYQAPNTTCTIWYPAVIFRTISTEDKILLTDCNEFMLEALKKYNAT